MKWRKEAWQPLDILASFAYKQNQNIFFEVDDLKEIFWSINYHRRAFPEDRSVMISTGCILRSAKQLKLNTPQRYLFFSSQRQSSTLCFIAFKFSRMPTGKSLHWEYYILHNIKKYISNTGACVESPYYRYLAFFIAKLMKSSVLPFNINCLIFCQVMI